MENSINSFPFRLQSRIRLGANGQHFPQELAALVPAIIEGLSLGRSSHEGDWGWESPYILCPFIILSLVDNDRQEKPYGEQTF